MTRQFFFKMFLQYFKYIYVYAVFIISFEMLMMYSIFFFKMSKINLVFNLQTFEIVYKIA